MPQLIHRISVFVALALLAGMGAGCTSKVELSYHLKRANRYFEAGQYEQAEIEYENVLREDRQNSTAWDRLSDIYYNEGRGPETMPVLLQAEKLDPTNLDIRLKLAASYLDFAHPKEAADEAAFVLSKDSRNEQAPILLATAVTNDVGAVRLSLQALQRKGDSAGLETALGLLAIRQKDTKTAADDFHRAIAFDPNFSEAYTALGSVFLSKKDLKHADGAFQKAARLAPIWSGNGLHYAQFKVLVGDTVAGEWLLKDMVSTNPLYFPAWTALAQLSASQNDCSNAMALVANVLNRDPRNFNALLIQGRIELLQRRPAGAVADYKQMAELYPDEPSVLYALAQSYLANNQTNQADAALSRALDLNSDFTDAILLRAETEIARGNPALAIVTLNALVRRHPLLPRALLLLAQAYRAQGVPDRAIDIYRTLEDSYPGEARVPVLLGTLLFQQNQLDSARAQFLIALRIQPDYVPAIEQLVNLDLTEKQYTAALQRVEQLVVRDPNQAVSQLLLGATLAAGGETNKAESALTKAIKLQPDSQAAYLLLARLYTQAGQSRKALQQLEMALNTDPNDLTATMLEGIIYDSLADYENARDAYKKIVAAAPDNAAALNNLACLYADHFNQLDKAYPLARRARDFDPSNPYIADTLGWILYRRGEYTPALVALRESAAKLPSIPEIQFHLGMASYMAGYDSDAITAFKRALQLNLEFPEKDDCRQRLAILTIEPEHAAASTRVWLEKWTVSHGGDPIAFARLAAIYQSNGMTNKALAADQAILAHNPQDIFALANLAQLYAATDPTKACSFAKSAYEASSGDPGIAHLYGDLAFKTGDYSWALTLLQLAAQAQPRNSEVLFDLGQALYSVGKVSEAQTFAKEALQSDNGFPHADDARRFLAVTGLPNNLAQTSSSQIDQILSVSPGYVPALMVKAALALRNSDTATARKTYTQVLKIYPDFTPARKKLAMLNTKNRQ
ncbi:MAG: tetratricopeptide repeat protein [Limisphaerales bacterium]